MKEELPNFTCIGTARLIENILSGDLNLTVYQEFLDEEKINSGWSDDDLDSRVKFGIIDGLNKGFGAGERTVCGRDKKRL